ncbi:hypothetical protein Q6247_25575, partial [Klebsiella pneumoniae]
MQLCDRLSQTPYHCLSKACHGSRDFESSDREYYEDAYAEPDEKFRVASRCIYAHYLALFWNNREVEVLRKGWDNFIGTNTMLEGKIEGLESCL